jgi:hypothetical protein
MSKRLQEELEAPDLKMARERKERRQVEAKGIVLGQQPVVGSIVPNYVEPESIEDIAKKIEEEQEKEIEKEIQEVRKKRGRPPLKKWR